ncbi:predicted protein [Sclerotinia sclerotiorum 1980 UF-70]|uniref:Uncharacterized protein n=1 Tax=Sclerotinia sclerotiorum (strain ATCC 18683 / 1980 / Ss-1) TaxID=665079 RepID=A7EZ49_SCLS1|nr:predicted protein [Sclerotinia sclerotiorum 1980 UF-70]EDN94741.1 predicted protein [Sclerotinia sclerotiorum 1980 UF-70]
MQGWPIATEQDVIMVVALKIRSCKQCRSSTSSFQFQHSGNESSDKASCAKESYCPQGTAEYGKSMVRLWGIPMLAQWDA